MSWRITNDPKSGLAIEHVVEPRFAARWKTGEFPIKEVRDGAFFWTDEGGGPEDTIHLYGFTWQDQPPGRQAFERLMRDAVAEIERHIMRQA